MSQMQHLPTSDENENSEYIPDTVEESVVDREKSIFEEPIFYATLIVVGIAGFLATRKARNTIRRKRLRAARRFRGAESMRSGSDTSEWDEHEVGIGS